MITEDYIWAKLGPKLSIHSNALILLKIHKKGESKNCLLLILFTTKKLVSVSILTLNWGLINIVFHYINNWIPRKQIKTSLTFLNSLNAKYIKWRNAFILDLTAIIFKQLLYLPSYLGVERYICSKKQLNCLLSHFWI